MIFAIKGHIQKILSGEKAQTRRRRDITHLAHIYGDGYSDKIRNNIRCVTDISKKYNPRLKWEVGKEYAVQPGRGKPSVGRIKILAIRKEKVSDISESDAIAEGGYTRPEYLDLWQKMYKVDPMYDWCWVISFKVVKG